MRVYFDHSATTSVKQEVVDKMLPFFTNNYGNASSQHFFGREAVAHVDNARDIIAKELNCKSGEIYFTSGGTEADNWAIKGIALANKNRGKHIMVSAIEHAAILESARQLEKYGFEVSYIPVDKDGRVDIDFIEKNIRDDTTLVAVMYVNNEVGTIQDVKRINEIAKSKKAYFLTDAVQATSSLKLDVKDLGCDLMTISAHKIGGPKGIGLLYVRSGVRIEKLLTGGHQERMMRGGTTNVPLIVGFAEAVRLNALSREENNVKVKAIRDHFVDRVLKEIPFVTLNGSVEHRVVSNANFSFEFIEGESILFSLDLNGIAVSSGSACSSGSLLPSHVLLAMGVKEELAHGSIRFSFGEENSIEEVDYAVDKLKEIVEKLRNLSPLFKVEGEIKNV